MRGRIRYRFDGWPPESALPNRELTWHIDLAVRQLAAPLKQQGWVPDEPLDARSLWEAGRVDCTIEPKGLLPGKYEVALRELRVRFRRHVAHVAAEPRAQTSRAS
jgi:hypothetical protein